MNPGFRRYFDYPAGRVNYLTHISRRHRAVFVEVPKTGCTVIKTILQASELPERPASKPASVHERTTSPLGAPVSDGFDPDEVFGPQSPYFRFAFARNPYSRVLSCYLEKIAGEQRLRDLRLPKLGFRPDEEVGFRAFLERIADQKPTDMDIHWAPQSHLLSLHKVSYGFIGRFESFQPDLIAVVDHLGLSAPVDMVRVQSPHTTNARDRIGEYFDDECTKIVQSVYRHDFDRLGYGLDPSFA